MEIKIKEGTAAEAAAFLADIPEFTEGYPPEEYQKRFAENEHLILLAYDATEQVVLGCKVGYRLEEDCFYSWMGAVLPGWRRHGVAEVLAQAQENWAIKRAYKKVRFKTRNSCRAMLHFALRRGFNIIGVEPREKLSDYRIWLEKELKNEARDEHASTVAPNNLQELP